jgi:hypothetical protein
MNARRLHEDWYGRPGTIAEALGRTDLAFQCARHSRNVSAKIEGVQEVCGFLGTTRGHLGAAIRSERRRMRRQAGNAVGWALVALVRMQTGGSAA